MENKIEITSIWEDESLFEVKVFATNGFFSGTAYCYTTREEMEKLGKLLTGYPKTLTDEISFSTGPHDNFSFFSLALKCIDKSGHIKARVTVAHIVTYGNAPQEKYLSEFDLEIEPAGIDAFSTSLQELAKADLGEIKAILKGRT